jgi:hypothetical protein
VTMIKQFGRKWEILVRTPGEEFKISSVAPPGIDQKHFEPLRVVFEISEVANYGAFWFADITFYNLNPETQGRFLSIDEGMEVIINAGYENEVHENSYGEIFRGRVFQPLWERENSVDFKATLHCITGRDVLSDSVISTNYKAYSSQNDLIKQMASRNTTKTPTVYQTGKRQPLQWSIDARNLPDTPSSRGDVLFGSPRKYLDQMARENGMQWWYDGTDTVKIADLAKNQAPETITYTPTSGIIGTPQQTREGASIRILLDPRFRVKLPAMKIKIDNSNLKVLPVYPGEFPRAIDLKAEYLVAGVRHVGDTRGNSWYTEITGVTAAYANLMLIN